MNFKKTNFICPMLFYVVLEHVASDSATVIHFYSRTHCAEYYNYKFSFYFLLAITEYQWPNLMEFELLSNIIISCYYVQSSDREQKVMCFKQIQ